jgi:uncharacterized protein (UPF0335 family)
VSPADNPRAVAGNNSGVDMVSTKEAKDKLKAIIDRVERLEDEKSGIAQDIRDVYAEAKGNGYDVKALRKLIAMRKRDQAELKAELEIMETYGHALGMDVFS